MEPPRLERLEVASLGEGVGRRLLGRYGSEATFLLSAAGPEERQLVPGTRALWAELTWAARAEGVVHLDDLLLRRVRLGLLLPDGGLRLEARIRALCQRELGWNAARWREEKERYRSLWNACYAPPLGCAEPAAQELSA